MSIKTIIWASSVKTGSPELKLVLTMLAQGTGGDHSVALDWDQLSEECEMTKRQLGESLRELVHKGLINYFSSDLIDGAERIELLADRARWAVPSE